MTRWLGILLLSVVTTGCATSAGLKSDNPVERDCAVANHPKGFLVAGGTGLVGIALGAFSVASWGAQTLWANHGYNKCLEEHRIADESPR